ncbi:site-specific DNA-methyltransferase [Lactobacillus amylovorus]|uniref:site-specific DNA-methyltransferase n=1 Tax=Lactobacillus amylovorus TaxID=1604 RepID=UPI00232EC17E|nr:site-specific DNA-methyltransferase [Lactobacillus amylovorus]MDB6237343.1 site-specific DNA-methyltransferase [Lactobacillus amylovorus]
MAVESKAMDHIRKVLEQFGDKYFSKSGALKRNAVIEDLDNYDKDLMTAILKDDLLHKTYTSKIADVEIFEINKFVDMLRYKEYWEDSFTKYDNKIGLTAGGKYIDDSSDVVLDFPYKDCVLKAGMTKEDVEHSGDADEPFLNETLAKPEIDELLEPKIFVNATKYDQNGKTKAGSISDDDNLIIKGNNLIALYSLEKKYAGKVKLIYLDPPYNTGSDSFKYNDRFNHATWLTFMKNRIEISKKLLTSDGIIAIQTDYHEQAYLEILMDEIFGRSNFVSNVAIKMSTASGPKMANITSSIPKLKDSLLIYSNGDFKINKQPYKLKEKWDKEYSKILMNFTMSDRKILDNLLENQDVSGIRNLLKEVKLSTISKEYPQNKTNKIWLKENAWRIVADKQNTGLDSLLATLGENWVSDISAIKSKKGKITLFRTDKNFGDDTRVEIVFADKNMKEHVGDLWTDISTSGGFSKEGNVKFPTAKKPEKLLKRIIEMFSKPNDLVLDFFAGSGSTAAVALKLNRNFITVDQMNYINNITVKRIVNVINGDTTGISKTINWQGGGSFIYAELMEKNQGYLKDLQDAENVDELMNVYSRMKQNGDIDFRVDLNKFEVSLKVGELPTLEDRKRELIKIIDKNQLYYNYSDIDDENVRSLISDTDYEFNKSFYSSNTKKGEE